jgi:D-alanyl-D-alanine carboxypeptidase/D-alanyl-D-alanine-endopeptidase (penicillin-binding protein 4)
VLFIATLVLKNNRNKAGINRSPLLSFLLWSIAISTSFVCLPTRTIAKTINPEPELLTSELIKISTASGSQTQEICVADLKPAINEIIEVPELRRSRVGVYARALPGSSINHQQVSLLINIEGDRLFLPASNAKLFTTAAALKLLGANFKFQTRLATQTPPTNGKVTAPLLIISSGNPSLTPADLANLIAQLKNAGITELQGLGVQNLAPNDTSYLGYGWEWQDLPEYYAAEPHPLTVHENVLDWTIAPTEVGKAVKFTWDDPELAVGWIVHNYATTGAIDSEYTLAVQRIDSRQELVITGQIPLNATPELGTTALPDPQQHFLSLLRAELIKQGIAIAPLPSNSSYQTTTNTELVSLASVASPALARLIQTINKDSNNLYAELILQAIARHTNNPDAQNITYANADQIYETAIEKVTEFLTALGIDQDSYVIADGSGLSRHNLIAPEAIVTLLVAMQDNQTFRDSLAIAAVDGTLKNRFKDTIAANNLTAKTGTLSGVVTLSGYVTTRGGEEVAFSIMINNGIQPTWQLREYVDAIALLFANLGDC